MVLWISVLVGCGFFAPEPEPLLHDDAPIGLVHAKLMTEPALPEGALGLHADDNEWWLFGAKGNVLHGWAVTGSEDRLETAPHYDVKFADNAVISLHRGWAWSHDGTELGMHHMDPKGRFLQAAFPRVVPGALQSNTSKLSYVSWDEGGSLQLIRDGRARPASLPKKKGATLVAASTTDHGFVVALDHAGTGSAHRYDATGAQVWEHAIDAGGASHWAVTSDEAWLVGKNAVVEVSSSGTRSLPLTGTHSGIACGSTAWLFHATSDGEDQRLIARRLQAGKPLGPQLVLAKHRSKTTSVHGTVALRCEGENIHFAAPLPVQGERGVVMGTFRPPA